MNTKFGLLLSGPVIEAERPTEIIETHYYRIEVKPAQDSEMLNEILPRFLELDSLGIADSPEVKVLRHFAESASTNKKEGKLFSCHRNKIGLFCHLIWDFARRDWCISGSCGKESGAAREL